MAWLQKRINKTVIKKISISYVSNKHKRNRRLGIIKSPDAELAKCALSNAINHKRPDTSKLMFHSDQGTQYTANMFAVYCEDSKITRSMRRGNCWDNAVMKRFFGNLMIYKSVVKNVSNKTWPLQVTIELLMDEWVLLSLIFGFLSLISSLILFLAM